MEFITYKWLQLNPQTLDRLQLIKASLKRLVGKVACHGMIHQMQHQNFEYPEGVQHNSGVVSVFVYITLMELVTSNWLHNSTFQVTDIATYKVMFGNSSSKTRLS